MTEFAMKPPETLTIGMKGISVSGEYFTLIWLRNDAKFGCFWKSMARDMALNTDSAGRTHPYAPTPQDISLWEVVPEELNESVNNSHNQEN